MTDFDKILTEDDHKAKYPLIFLRTTNKKLNRLFTKIHRMKYPVKLN